jgi:phosphomannomutase/phosphoglucomutase
VGTFYWAQYYLDRKAGVYVTASHNPAEYNGCKFAIDFSETLVSEGMEELRRIIENEEYIQSRETGQVVKKDIRKEYFKDLLKRIRIDKSFKVVVDPSNSTAGSIAPELFRQAGCKVIESNCELIPSFPLGTPDPTEAKVAKRLSGVVLEEGADIGFSYDADGDRIGIVDEKGNVIWNDVLVAIFAMDVLENHPHSKIMFNILCSRLVRETILKHGGEPFMWRVGHSFLKKKNQEVKAAFIGELSGHFFFSADFYNHDDGLYSALRLLSYLSREGKTLSSVVDSLPKYISSPEIKLYCSDDKKVELIKKISIVSKKDFPEGEVIDDERAGDGVRIDFPDAMFIVRYSQNGPYITIKFEAKEEKKYNSLKSYINNLLRDYKEIDWNSKINVNLESILE